MAKVIQGDGADADPAKVDNPTPNSTSPISPVPPPPLLSGDRVKLMQDADLVIINYFSSHPELFADANITSDYGLVVVIAVPKLVQVRPFTLKDTTATNAGRRITYDSLPSPSLEHVQEYLIRVCGDAVKELDLFSNPSLFSGNKLEELLPEYALARSLLSGEYYNISLFAVVLAMDPSLRDIPALALAKSGAKDTAPFNILNSSTNPFDYLQSTCTPSTAAIVYVAREYGVKDIIPILEELVKAKSIFTKEWNT